MHILCYFGSNLLAPAGFLDTQLSGLGNNNRIRGTKHCEVASAIVYIGFIDMILSLYSNLTVQFQYGQYMMDMPYHARIVLECDRP